MTSGVSIRILKDKIFGAAVIALSVCAIAPLLFILAYIIKEGASSISWGFLTHLPAPVGETGGGVSNAVIGTGMLIVLAVVFSVPLGIGAGLFLYEFREGSLSFLVRTSVEVLQGVPSIVIGIVAYAWIVAPLRTFSALSGAAALGLMMLPLVVKATEETLILIPSSLKEAGLALGAPYYRTVLKVILPAGLGGILTGVLLGVARVSGETAPLLFTAFGNPFMNLNVLKPVNSLPLLIYNYAKSPYPDWQSQAWGASFVLVVLVLSVNSAARLVAARWKIRF